MKAQTESVSGRLSSFNESIFHLFQLNINQDNNKVELSNLLNLTLAVTEEGQVNSITNTNLFLNKYREEGYIIVNKLKNSYVFYFSPTDDKQNKFVYLKNDYKVRGWNFHNSPELFTIDILHLESGLWNIYYTNGVLNVIDKTNVFIQNVISNYYSDNQDISASSKFQHFFPGNYPLLENINDNKIENLHKLFNNTLNEYYKKINENTVKSKADLENEEIRLKDHNIENFHLKLQSFEYDQIVNMVGSLLFSIIDDESLNVDVINKNSIKAELVIIEYLLQKEKKINVIFDFLNYFQIFQKFDPHKTIFLTYLQYKEKLTVAIKLREFENNIIDKKLLVNSQENIQNYIKNDRLLQLNNIAQTFITRVYTNLKNYWSKRFSDTPFSKQLVYSKISDINSYIDNLFDIYSISMEDLKISKDEKVLISYILIILWNNIIFSIKTLHEEVYYPHTGPQDFNSYQNNPQCLWLLSEDYLKNLKLIFTKFLEFYPALKNIYPIDFVADYLIYYVDHILYLFDMYFKINYSIENDKISFNLKKEMIGRIIEFDAERSLKIACKYKDYYSITIICYNNQWIDKFKEIMSEYINNRNIILYFLKLYLFLEADNLRKNPMKKVNFEFFENFTEFSIYIEEICKSFPKLNFFYQIFLKSKTPMDTKETTTKLEELVKSVNEKRNVHIFLKIEKILNSINRCNLDAAMLNKNKNREDIDIMDRNKEDINEKDLKEINFCLLVNFLKNSFNLTTVDYSNIFNSFENYIKEFLSLEKKEIDIFMKYKISFQLITLAREISYKIGNKNIFEYLYRVI